MKFRKVINSLITEAYVSPYSKTLANILNDYKHNGYLDDIPMPDGELGDLFNQYLGLIDELKFNDINSDDFLNWSNLGLKADGNLAMFDIGYGNYFEEFETDLESIIVSPRKNMLDSILDFYQINSAKYIGGGHFGYAYDIGGGKILKITKDKTEAINSEKILGKNMKHLANVYKVKQIKYKDKQFYVIILEKLKVSNDLKDSLKSLSDFFLHYINKHYKKNILLKIKDKNELIGSFLLNIYENGYSEGWKNWGDKLSDKYGYDILGYDFNDIADIVEWFDGSATNEHYIDDEPPEYVDNIVKALLK